MCLSSRKRLTICASSLSTIPKFRPLSAPLRTIVESVRKKGYGKYKIAPCSPIHFNEFWKWKEGTEVRCVRILSVSHRPKVIAYTCSKAKFYRSYQESYLILYMRHTHTQNNILFFIFLCFLRYTSFTSQFLFNIWIWLIHIASLDFCIIIFVIVEKIEIVSIPLGILVYICVLSRTDIPMS